MVRPANFGFNAETAESNVFQCREKHNTNVQELALQEFDSFVSKLKAAEVPVVVVQDTHDVVSCVLCVCVVFFVCSGDVQLV